MRFPLGADPRRYGFNAEPFRVIAHDSVALACCILRTPDPHPKGTVLMLHGISACKEHNFGLARMLNDNGWHVALTDLRAHGQSGGAYCTFGYYEKRDMSLILTEIALRDCPPPYGIFGESLGGAVAIQALAADARWNFGVVESTFDDLVNVAAQYGYNWFGFRSHALAAAVMQSSGRIANFPPDSVCPMHAAKSVRCPVFVAHGANDEKIPADHTQRIFQNLASAEKERVVVAGAGHSDLHSVGGAEHEQRILRFLDRQSRKFR